MSTPLCVVSAAARPPPTLKVAFSPRNRGENALHGFRIKTARNYNNTEKLDAASAEGADLPPPMGVWASENVVP